LPKILFEEFELHSEDCSPELLSDFKLLKSLSDEKLDLMEKLKNRVSARNLLAIQLKLLLEEL